jgi:hypothetical protein
MATFWLKLMIDGIAAALLKNGDLARKAQGRITMEQSAPGTLLDCVEYRRTDGGVVNESPRDEVRTIWEIYGISTDEASALAMAEAIHHTMTENGIDMGSGWDNYRHKAVDASYRIFWSEGQKYFAIGEFYDLDAARRG